MPDYIVIYALCGYILRNSHLASRFIRLWRGHSVANGYVNIFTIFCKINPYQSFTWFSICVTDFACCW